MGARGFRARMEIDPAVLDAGDVVAGHLGIPRKDVFRTMRAADVMTLAQQVRAGTLVREEAAAHGE
jgi:hypothetical protein